MMRVRPWVYDVLQLLILVVIVVWAVTHGT